MSKTVYITTTGTQDPVSFRDLGGRSFAHPTTNYNLTSEYQIETIRKSSDFFSKITSGYITAKFEDDTSITEASDMFPINRKDKMLQCTNNIKVKQNPGYGEFSSINAAIASISGATEDNRFVVEVCPGLYTETEITVPQYVFIIGKQIDSIIIEPSGNHNVVNLSQFSGLEHLTIKNAPTGYAGVNVSNAGDFCTLTKVTITACDIGVLCNSTSVSTVVFLEYVDFQDCSTNSIKITNSGIYSSFINFENLYIGYYTTPPADCVLIDGNASEMNVQGGQVIANSNIGNGFRMTNGGYLNISSGRMEDLYRAFYVDNNGSDSYLKVQAFDFDDNIYDIIVDSSTATGFYSGDYDAAKIIINNNSPFYIANISSQRIVVEKQGGQFQSIKLAVDSITDASLTKPYTILIGPGIYIEDTIMLKSNISIIGQGRLQTIIQASSPNQYIFDASGGGIQCVIRDLKAQGSTGDGYYIINNETYPSNPIYNNILFYDCDFGATYGIAKTKSNGSINSITFDRCKNTMATNATNLFTISDDGIIETNLFIFNCQFTDSVSPSTENLITAHGSLTGVIIFNSGFHGDTTNLETRTGIVFYDGADLSILSSSVVGFDKCIWNKNIGLGSLISIQGLYSTYNNTAIEIDSPLSAGFIISSCDKEKVIINELSTVTINITDIDDGSVSISGDLFLGDTYAEKTNISPILQHGQMTGIIDGGILSSVSELIINITLGNGYLITGTNRHIKYIEWISQNLTLPAHSDNYVFIDSNGLLSSAQSIPNIFENIVVGKVRTNNSRIIFFQDVATEARSTSTKLERTLRLGFGPIYATGSQVSESGTRHIDVTGGRYYYGTHEFAPSGGTAIVWTKWINDGSGGWYTGSQSVVDNAYYNKISGEFSSSSSSSSSLNSYSSNSSISNESSSYSSNSSSSTSSSSTESHSESSSSSSSFSSDSLSDSSLSLSSSSSLSNSSSSYSSASSNSLSSESFVYDTLEPIPALEFAKHALYIANDGTHESYNLVYGQITFANITDAQNGVLPTPPSTWTANIVRIASLIVKQGTSTIYEIRDERPRLSFATSATANITNHGDLSGLGANDHPQYLLINGTGSMTGNLDIGTNSITNVNLVDGVDVSAHASRHLPNSGTDALTTSAPTTNLSVSSTNADGDTNSLSRGNHSHAITTASANTVSTIVARDASGNFSAGTITASLTGNATSATTATSANDPNALHKNVASEINGLTPKVTPAANDELVIEDSADSYNKKKILISALSATDSNAIHKNVAAEISTITEKTVTASADLVLIEDSADSNNKKRAQLGNLAVTDTNAIHKTTSGEIHALTLKSPPVGADEVVIEDSASTWGKKRATIASLPVTDTLAIHNATDGEINAITLKTTPITTDIVLIEDSASSFSKKKATIASLPVTDSSAIHTNVSGEINGLTAKTTPIAVDLIIIEDSADTNSKKKVKLEETLSAIRPYFNGVAVPSQTTTSATYTGVTNGAFTFTLTNSNYLVNACSELSISLTNATFQSRLLISGESATWTRVAGSTTITVTANSHGLITGDRIAVTASSNTSTIPLATYIITFVDVNTYTFTGVNTGTTSGTLTYSMIMYEISTRFSLANAFQPFSNSYVLSSLAGSKTFTFQWNTANGTLTGRNFRLCLTKLS